MKKMNNRWQSVLLSLALFGLAACTGDFEDINRNPNQVTDDQMDALNYKTGTKFKALQSLVIPVQEHMYQFNESLSGGPFGGYIGATVDTWQTKFETYNPSADWRKWPFANVITETYTPYKGIVNGTEDEVAIAFARLLRVAIMHRVTDSYGPIPYSKLESNESVYVEYDSQVRVRGAGDPQRLFDRAVGRGRMVVERGPVGADQFGMPVAIHFTVGVHRHDVGAERQSVRRPPVGIEPDRGGRNRDARLPARVVRIGARLVTACECRRGDGEQAGYEFSHS